MIERPRELNIRRRISAWWHGYDMTMPAVPAAGSASEASSGAPAEARPSPGERRDWTRERVYVIQLIFGEGSHGPSIEARTKDMIAPLALTPEMTMLELGSGLGLGSRTIARDTGAWIDGIEPNLVLAGAARRLNAGTEARDKVTVSSQPLDDPEIQRRRRDAIISQESLHRFEDPGSVLRSAREIMKPTAQLVLTDFIMADGADRTQLAAWTDLNPSPVHLSTIGQFRELLGSCGFNVHSVRDETDDYVAGVLQSLQAFAVRLNERPLPEHWREWIMVEVEYWARLVATLERGALQLYRLSATPLV